MKTKFLLTALVIALGITGCGTDGLDSNAGGDVAHKTGENFTFYTDDNMFSYLEQNRSGEVSEDFEITGVQRIEEDGRKYLHIEIAHQTCHPDTKIIWNGTVADSHPPQVFLFVQLLASGECTDEDNPDERKEILRLDLYDLIGDEYIAENAIFSVANASTVHDNNDHSDEPVSSDGQ
jgi:hypothetical protein